ncbi:unnamed protein product [Euphydryas editha]|uniref:Reverse transcriptase domain-containing protein n=1 Tax=Euphydryas editha TaxID=104508 RepID=A0AAU9VBS3_EUPED|nr:unnamed protein product [Euphydryas editha]
MCREAKRRYVHSTIENSDCKQVCKFLKSFGIGKSPTSGDNSVDLNALNTHFSTSPTFLDDLEKSKTISDLSRIILPLCSSFALQPVTQEEVKNHILSISSTAVGYDGICSRMIRLIIPELLPLLTHLFNYSMSTCIYPSIWKKAHVVPLSKINKPTLLSHYRPISILPFLSKVMEHVVHNQLSRYMASNCLLNPWQSGFRTGHSTVTALLKVSEDIRFAMDNRNLTIVVLLDFSNAFNSVDFDILLVILRSLNISSSACNWFDSYLRGRSQCVHLGENRSNWRTLKSGVPQGSVLSPLLFSTFINTITTVISSKFHLYADDLQLYRHFSVVDSADAIACMNEDLKRIYSWARRFGLVVNPAKSQALIIGSRHMLSRLSLNNINNVLYDGVPINYVDTAKNLGLHFSSDLSWSKHINEISKKVHFSIQSLKNLQYFLPIKTKILLAQSVLLPLLDYADSCYLDATEEQLNKLERLQNINDFSEVQERSQGKNYGNENSPHLSPEINESSQNIEGENRARPRENNFSQDCGRKRKFRDDLPPEIRAARRQIDEAFEYIKEKKDDEYDMFGRLISSKIKKISNPNTRDMLMNDINNLVFRTCMADRLEQQSTCPTVPQFSTFQSSHQQISIPLSSPPTYQSPPNPSTYQLSLGHSTSLSPRHHVYSPSPNSSSYQSPPGPSTFLSPHRQVSPSPSPNSSTYQSMPGPSTSVSPHQLFIPSPNPSTYQSPPDPSTSLSPQHEISNQLPLDQFSQSSQQNFLELPPRASQIVITNSGEIKVINNRKIM